MAARRSPGPGPALLVVLAVLGPGRPLPAAHAALNLQELRELQYRIEILAEPVPAGQIQGLEEVQKERRQQQALEENYCFGWGRRREPQPPEDPEDLYF